MAQGSQTQVAAPTGQDWGLQDSSASFTKPLGGTPFLLAKYMVLSADFGGPAPILGCLLIFTIQHSSFGFLNLGQGSLLSRSSDCRSNLLWAIQDLLSNQNSTGCLGWSVVDLIKSLTLGPCPLPPPCGYGGEVHSLGLRVHLCQPITFGSSLITLSRNTCLFLDNTTGKDSSPSLLIL